MWFSYMTTTNLTVQAHKMATGWKFCIEKVEELFYPCSENKGAEADLRLCFRICKMLDFSCHGSFSHVTVILLSQDRGH